MVNVAIIPARLGSKRIKRKNIKLFNGLPIISYPINALINSSLFDKIIVSTDSPIIGDIAINFGAEGLQMRPAHLSNDFTGTLPVIQHEVEYLSNKGIIVEDVACVYATSVLISSDIIVDAYAEFKKSQSQVLFAATKFEYPIQRAVRRDGTMLWPENYEARSQDLEDCYHDAGQFYFANSQHFLSRSSILGPNSQPYILPRDRVQDIDEPEDWQAALLKFKKLSE
jgi:N-acylneuraminate cytidylyltransferase